MSRELIVLRLRDGAVAGLRRYRGGRRTDDAPADRRPAAEMARLAAQYPDADLAWYDVTLEPLLRDVVTWPDLRRHLLEVLHGGALGGADLAAPSLARVDFDSWYVLPPRPDRRDPTWLVSDCAGLVHARVVGAVGLDKRFKTWAAALLDFGHRGLQHGVCPYSEPDLLARDVPDTVAAALRRPIPDRDIAVLVRRLYGRRWVAFWLIGSLLYRRSFHLPAAARGWLARGAEPVQARSLEALGPVPTEPGAVDPTIDVIVPTLGRPGLLRDLLEDLSLQTLRPRMVIVVDQRTGPAAATETGDITTGTWPFEVEHHFTDWVGACRARNLGLRSARGEWLLFLDDDVRLPPGLIAHLVGVAGAYDVEAVTAATLLPHQLDDGARRDALPTMSSRLATCASLVRRALAEKAGGFDERLEGGYGEDSEFGIRLRRLGAVVLRTPAEPVLHLKAPFGGFRSSLAHPWKDDAVAPHPSPTILLSRQRLPEAMRQGYQLYYVLKRLGTVPPHRALLELPRIARAWKSSVKWAERMAGRVTPDVGFKGR
jgi:hypothetical protein